MSDNQLSIRKTDIPGMYVVELVLHSDSRGWFKENYQKQKLEQLGLPKFEIVQNNFSHNIDVGVTRGLHAEPWEKYISVANGRVFGAWVDLRKGDSFGKVFTLEITPDIAVFVPRGIANGYQTLEKNVTYTYLVNDHWSPNAQYSFLNLYDSDIAIKWPISQTNAIISEKDSLHPKLSQIIPMDY